MKKNLFVLLAGIVMISNAVFAQDFLGFRQSNYSGVNGVDMNPASLADNRFIVDVVLFGGSMSAYNNHIYFNPKNMPYWWTQSFVKENQDPAVDHWLYDDTLMYPYFGSLVPADSANYYQSINDGNFFEFDNPKRLPRTAYLATDMEILSFMFSFNQKNEMGVAVQIKNRTFLNVDHLSPDLLTLVQNGLEYPDLWNLDLTDKLLNVSFNSWMEYNVGFGMKLWDNGENHLKAGVKLKFLQGLGSFYMYTDNVDYNFANADTANYIKGDFDYGYSANFDTHWDANNSQFIGGSGTNDAGVPDSSLIFKDIYKLNSKLGFGADIGFSYEYRPKWQDYKYDMDGETNLWRRDKNKYLLKFDFAVNDIGGMRYLKSDNSRNFRANTSIFDLAAFEGTNSLEEFNHRLDSLEAIGNGDITFIEDKRTFYMNLPTHINTGLDLNIWNDFYIRFNSMIGFQMNKDAHKVRYPTNFTVTPRYDFMWAGLSAPMSYSGLTGFRVGLGLRMGPIIVGVGDMKWLFSPTKDKQVRGADLYAALKVPILYTHPKDIDNDKVSDKLDLCLETPGVWEFMGCPDTDMDGIQDSEDACPTEAGPKEFQGCPDRDGDKIIDKNDQCPDDPGLAEFFGCPDTDGDRIIDKKDDCPDVPGIELFNGCPDTDGDGLKDSDDLCPEVAGPKENQGCPDTDNDGIFDYLDACPLEAGPQENRGCPWPDTDGDGLLDKDDKCPYNAGPPSNDGCPYTDTDGDGVIDKEDECVNTPGPKENKGCPQVDLEVLKRAFDNLQFETAKAVILDVSYESLEDLAEYLVNNPDFRLKIAGHTDSQGEAQKNLILSKKRAEAVRDFLESRGVNTDRMIVQYYGEEKPVDTNDTPEGRARNRRVEMEVIFE
ncbi:MAG: OmpA family protein [Crocinitomicaceae bacterium]|nr:OmpA family protein [Crocinitomicaceae bacterium]